MLLGCSRSLFRKPRQNTWEWIGNGLAQPSGSCKLVAASIAAMHRCGRKCEFPTAKLWFAARRAIDWLDPVLKRGERTLRHQNTHHLGVQVHSVYPNFAVRFIRIGFVPGFTERMNMDTLFFAAAACPDKSWIRSPYLDTARKI